MSTEAYIDGAGAGVLMMHSSWGEGWGGGGLANNVIRMLIRKITRKIKRIYTNK